MNLGSWANRGRVVRSRSLDISRFISGLEASGHDRRHVVSSLRPYLGDCRVSVDHSAASSRCDGGTVRYRAELKMRPSSLGSVPGSCCNTTAGRGRPRR